MKTKPDFKFGDQVVLIADDQKRGAVSRVFQSCGLWWLQLEGEPNWRYEPSHFRRDSVSAPDLAREAVCLD
jgi:hypothetical protein